MELSQTHNEIGGEAAAYLHLGKAKGKTDPSSMGEAEDLILKGTKIWDDFKAMNVVNKGILALSELYVSTGRTKEALEKLTTVEAAFKEMGMDYFLARTHALTAELYKKEGNQSKAVENLTKAIDIMEELEAYGWVERYQKELAELN